MSRGYLFAFVLTLMFHCLKIVTQQIYSLNTLVGARGN